MMDPLYMYLTAAYEHLRSQETNQKIGEIEVKGIKSSGRPKKRATYNGRVELVQIFPLGLVWGHDVYLRQVEGSSCGQLIDD